MIKYEDLEKECNQYGFVIEPDSTESYSYQRLRICYYTPYSEEGFILLGTINFKNLFNKNSIEWVREVKITSNIVLNENTIKKYWEYKFYHYMFFLRGKLKYLHEKITDYSNHLGFLDKAKKAAKVNKKLAQMDQDF